MDQLSPAMGLFVWTIIALLGTAIVGFVFYKLVMSLKDYSKKLDGK